MKITIVLLLSLLLSLLSTPGWTDDETNTNNETISLKTSTGESARVTPVTIPADDSARLALELAKTASTITDDEEANPGTVTVVVAVEAASVDVTLADTGIGPITLDRELEKSKPVITKVIPETRFGKLKARLKALLTRHSQMIFAPVRLVLNTGGIAWGLFISMDSTQYVDGMDMVFRTLPPGILGGLMSMGLVLKREWYRKFVAGGNFWWERVFYINVIYAGAVGGLAEITHASLHSPSSFVANILLAAGTNVVTQGLFTRAIASNTNNRIAQDPENTLWHDAKGDSQNTAVSFAGVTLGALKYGGSWLFYPLAAAMTALGIKFYRSRLCEASLESSQALHVTPMPQEASSQ